MNRLSWIEDMGLKVTWKLIKIGLYGCDIIPPILTYAEMFEYLDNELNEITEETDNIILLFCERDTLEELPKHLERMALNDGSDIELQIRKWRVYILDTILKNFSGDIVQDLMELREFWMLMGRTNEIIPHYYPTFNPNDQPTYARDIYDYFTKKTYEMLSHQNHVWLKQELAHIIALEKQK